MPTSRFIISTPPQTSAPFDAYIIYFDSSALVKLVMEEEGSETVALLWDRAAWPVSNALSYPEVRAALAAARRDKRLTERSLNTSKQEWETYWGDINAVEPYEQLLHEAGDVAESYRLKGYDAVHLATAMRFLPELVIMVTWDRRLREAALQAGLRISPP